eukprot:s106_g8.t1
MALQSGTPFARHMVLSSAASADRDIGSEVLPDYVPEPLQCLANGVRYGEASHPGPDFDPDQLLTVGVSNPGGLRSKEDLVMELGAGVWTMTETQLSAVTIKNSARSFRSGGLKLNRCLRPHYSHPAPLRHGSTWAGKWTGVCTVSDWPSMAVDLPWPHEHWTTGRVLMTRHWINSTPVSVGGFYGYAQGPTWPKARQLSDQVLETFTREVVMGMSGVRILQGDYNQNPGALVQQQIWERYGWRNAQSAAVDLLNHEWMATCKNATEPDQIWLSPEALHLLRGIAIRSHFADHMTVSIQLLLPKCPTMILQWPRPAEIPWDKLSTTEWSPECSVHFDQHQDATSYLSDWAHAYEKSVSEHYAAHHHEQLHDRYKGRAQRLQPEKRELSAVICRPSREGEVCLQHSLVGTAVRQWFKQLRRLQSLNHAVRAGSSHASAVSYRISLWTSISKAPGFHPDFRQWWSHRESPADGAPRHLPVALPVDPVVMDSIYKDFLHHFRQFETWHIAQRRASLKQKYEGSLSSIYMDLRDEPKASADHVWHDEKYQVLAIDPDSGQLMLDRDIVVGKDSIWYHEGHQVSVSNVDGAVCTVSSTTFFDLEDEIVQRCFVSDVNDVLKDFTMHWSERWNLLSQIPPDDWTRIVQFTQAFLPQLSFNLPDLNAEMWYKGVNKFKPRAARGPDGFSKADLKHMPVSYVESLLQMFTCIEQSEVLWPRQLLTGLVIATAKCKDAHTVMQFRPLTLFSVLFRNWSKIRTRHLLVQLANYMPPEALGFLPHREAADVWLLLQGQIELMLTNDAPFCGLSSDLRRAFNHIGRRQIFHMGAHLGLPLSLLNAWRKFLGSFVRRFDLRGCVGDEIASDSGFPEGDPLSIIAMLVVNWGYHVYMHQFVPRVQAYSFVDNLTLAARDALVVIQGYFAMVTFSALCGLSLDMEKTYVWGLQRDLRNVLGQLGFPCVFEASELGSSMTYGAKIRNRLLKHRGLGMDEKWKKLACSMAPLPQKIAMLARVFWPKALHGSPACVFADQYVHGLRRAATKMLKLNVAGSNPQLRLSLSDNMQNDPGFYQLQHCIAMWRRMLRKSPDLLPMWRLWQLQYDGKARPGPFTKLLQLLHQIGWSVLTPPMLMDHEQHVWNLMLVDDKTLVTLLHDAWCQYISAMTKHNTMKDLIGMDHFLTTYEYGKLLPKERALLSALQCGAFVSSSEHARYDSGKSKMCVPCDCVDDRAHWLQCPRFQDLRLAIPGWSPDNVELPQCVQQHLLIPRLQTLTDWRDLLLQIEDRTKCFCFCPPKGEFLHLFVDGSCTVPVFPALRLAAWGVICATSGELVALGHLCGITQTIDRAELTSMVAAVSWTQSNDVCIWSDSLSTVTTAEYIQRFGHVPLTAENYDLWTHFLDALQLREGLQTVIRWIPSHVHHSVASDPFEEWAFKWNNIIDSIVAGWNHCRPTELLTCHEKLSTQLTWWADRVRQLRAFYFSAAERTLTEDQAAASEPIVIDSDVSDVEDVDLISDQLPLNWQVMCRQASGKTPRQFVELVLQWLCAVEQSGNSIVVVTDLEVLFMILEDPDFLFPFQLDGSTDWTLKRLGDLYQTPTAVMLLRPLQTALQQIELLFPDLSLRAPPRQAKELGLYINLRGVRACFPATSALNVFAQDPPDVMTAELAQMRPSLLALSCVTVAYFAAYAVLAVVRVFNQAQTGSAGPLEKALESSVMGVCFAPMLCVLFLCRTGQLFAMAETKTIAENFEGLEGMNLPVAQFVRKVALVTGFEEQILRSIPAEEHGLLWFALVCFGLLWFALVQWDTDSTGKISFDNFIQGVYQMRYRIKALQAQAAHDEEQYVLADSVKRAKDAFDKAGKKGKDQLSLEDFIEALSNTDMLQRISAATELPVTFFESLSAGSLLDLFKQVDACMSSYYERKTEEQEAMDAVREHAEDWNGEFDFMEFVTAFKTNSRFLRKVSLATSIPVQELRTLQTECISVQIHSKNMAHGLQHLHAAWQVEKAVTNDDESRVILLRFGHDYDPECKLMDDVLLAISDFVKAALTNRVSRRPLFRRSLSLWRCANFEIARATISSLWACQIAFVVARSEFSDPSRNPRGALGVSDRSRCGAVLIFHGQGDVAHRS